MAASHPCQLFRSIRNKYVDATISKHRRIDILVANAGIAGPNHKTWEYPVEEWQRVIHVSSSDLFATSMSTLRSASIGASTYLLRMPASQDRITRRGNTRLRNGSE